MAGPYFENLEGAHECLVHRHHGTSVVELAAVVGSAEEGDQLTFGEELVPILHHLVGPANQVEVVLVEEFGRHLCAERERHPAVVLAPAHRVLKNQSNIMHAVNRLDFWADFLLSKGQMFTLSRAL